MSTTVPVLVGALIGFIGSLGAATFTTATGRLQQERGVHGRVQRKAREIVAICNRVSPVDNYARESARVDELANDLDSLAFMFLRRVDRRDLRTCVAAVLDRTAYGPDPNRICRLSASMMEVIVKARAEQNFPLFTNSELPEWTKAELRGFRSQAEDEEERHRLNYEDQTRAEGEG